MKDDVAGLNAPPAVKIQTLKLMVRISQAANADELWRARSRAAGSVLAMETVEAQDAARIQGLYDTFEENAKARRQEEPSNT